MKAVFAIILFVSILPSALCQTLKDHRWEERVLIIQAFDKENLDYQKQLLTFTNENEGMAERKLVLYLMVGNEYMYSNYSKQEIFLEWQPLDDRFDTYVKEKKEFQLILIGLDGGVKLNRDSYIPQEELFRIIDSMPMRASEMRKKKG